MLFRYITLSHSDLFKGLSKEEANQKLANLTAPRETTILGYKFVLDGDPVDVKELDIAAKFEGMAHIGIIRAEQKAPKNFKEAEFTEEPVEKKSEYELLKEEASDLGIKYKGNIGKAALKELIKEHGSN